VEEVEIDRRMYTPEVMRSPESLSFPKGVHKKVTLYDGTTFFLSSTVKGCKALLNIMLAKGNRNDLEYIKNVLTAAVFILEEQNIKEIYATVGDKGLFMLKGLGKLELISREKWIRKIL
jgi:hypothetical protein